MVMMMLCGCGQSSRETEEPAPEEIVQTDNEPEISSEAEPAPEEEQPAETEQPAEEPAETPDPSVFTGVRTQHTYENEYFGVRCDLDEDWNIIPDDQFGLMAHHEPDADFYEVVNAGKTWHDLMALYFLADDDIYVYLYPTEYELTDEQLKQEQEKQVENDIREQAFQPLSNMQITTSSVQLLSQDALCIRAEYKLSDKNMYQQNIYLKKDRLLMRISVSTAGQDKTDELLAKFSE